MRQPSFVYRAGILLLSAVLSNSASADDGAIRAVGGTVELLDEHPTVHLRSEFVHAWLSNQEIRVECVFFLWNDGPATTVTIGFPNHSSGADVESNAPFKWFHSFVDGMLVDVEHLVDPEHQKYGDYRSWWVKEVEFREQEIKCIRNEYAARPGHSFPNYRRFGYLLSTGFSWAGPIEVAEVVVTLEGVPPDSLVSVEPAGYHQSANELRWHFAGIKGGIHLHMPNIHVQWKR